LYKGAIRERREDLVDEARRGLEHFRNRSWRCEAKDSTGQRRCKNYWNGHEKGHQFELSNITLLTNSRRSTTSVNSQDGLQVGNYQSSYDPEAFTDRLWNEVTALRNGDHSMEKLASAATSCGVAGLTTQRTCLACLSNTPTNMLPCRPSQHGICENCIRRYNPTSEEATLIQITSCPLGCSLTKSSWSIRVKPRTAGARILALDGFVAPNELARPLPRCLCLCDVCE